MGCLCFGGREKKGNEQRRHGGAFTGKPQVTKSSNTVGYSGNKHAYRNNKVGGGATRDGDMIVMIGAGAALAAAAGTVGDSGGNGGNYGGDGGCVNSGSGGCGGSGFVGGGGCGGGGGGGFSGGGGGGCGGGGGGC